MYRSGNILSLIGVGGGNDLSFGLYNGIEASSSSKFAVAFTGDDDDGAVLFGLGLICVVAADASPDDAEELLLSFFNPSIIILSKPNIALLK